MEAALGHEDAQHLRGISSGKPIGILGRQEWRQPRLVGRLHALPQETVLESWWISSMTATSALLISALEITCLTPYFSASLSSSREGKSVQIRMSAAG